MTGRVVDVDIDVSLGCSVDHGGAGKAGRRCPSWTWCPSRLFLRGLVAREVSILTDVSSVALFLGRKGIS